MWSQAGTISLAGLHLVKLLLLRSCIAVVAYLGLPQLGREAIPIFGGLVE